METDEHELAEASENWMNAIKKVGIAMEDAVRAADVLAEVARQCRDIDAEIMAIRANPCLSWWQKLRITRALRKDGRRK